jgi:hypothetical protein
LSSVPVQEETLEKQACVPQDDDEEDDSHEN